MSGTPRLYFCSHVTGTKPGHEYGVIVRKEGPEFRESPAQPLSAATPIMQLPFRLSSSSQVTSNVVGWVPRTKGCPRHRILSWAFMLYHVRVAIHILMFITVLCPDCREETEHEVLSESRDRLVRCTTCGHHHRIPWEKEPEMLVIKTIISREGTSLTGS